MNNFQNFSLHLIITMPREKSYEYTNKSGNHCTQYSDGSYAYKNASGSSYYDTGKGHAFYK